MTSGTCEFSYFADMQIFRILLIFLNFKIEANKQNDAYFFDFLNLTLRHRMNLCHSVY